MTTAGKHRTTSEVVAEEYRGEARELAQERLDEDRAREVLLRVNNLSVTLFTEDGHLPAITDLSFVMRKGETLAVVGESGCGKSMCALSIMGLLPQPPAKVTDGSIELGGVDMVKLTAEEMRQYRGSKIGMIFQEPMTSLNPVMTAGRQIREGLLVHNPKMGKRQADERALEMIRLVGIPAPEKVFKSYPHELSGGMRQRIMIAMALASRPSLLICDEPTTALDVTIQAQIIELMKKMQEENGNAIIMITHDLGVVADVADKIMVMYAGTPVEFGTADEIFYDSIHPYTWGLTRSIPDPVQDEKKPLTPIEGNPPSLVNVPEGCAFSPRCPYATPRCRSERPELHVTETGHYACCHYAGDAEFVKANAPATSRAKEGGEA